MTRTTQRTDPEEARKELLATLQASRELGPEMDDALTDRFIEQLSALRPAGSFDQAGTRARFHSLLQSVRGSDPAGDPAAAESFLAGIQPPRRDPQPYAYNAPPAPMQYGPMAPTPYGGAAQIAPMVIFAAIFIVALIVSGGHMWWLLWPLLVISGGWGRRNRGQRRLYRDPQRGYGNDRILNRDEVYGHLPPQQRPPEMF
jgi:hypothetical protein